LRVLDVGFNGGHGEEVLSVAKHLLTQLGFGAIVTSDRPTILPLELVPSTLSSAADAVKLLQAFREQYRVDDQILKSVESDAVNWLNAMTPVGGTFDIPDLVLASLMWHTFRDNWWVNVSARIRATTLRDVVDPVARESNAVLFAAVGNLTKKLTTGFVPQDHSLLYPQVVSVTCGRKAGDICGEHSHEVVSPFSPRVLIAGPGCGFSGTSGTGSSLATPYVAVASWLVHLIAADDESDESDSAELSAVFRRHDLLTANIPTPELSHRVESQGLFDPAYLLLRPPPHTVMTDGTLRLIDDFRVTPQCSDATGHATGPPLAQGTSRRRITETVLVYEKAGVPHYWEREIAGDTLTLRPCLLEGLTAEIAFKDGQRETYDYQKFREQIKWITWTPYRWAAP
jgi:hypothetical protein